MPEIDAAEAIAGDESAFAALTERHRRELHVHCWVDVLRIEDGVIAEITTFGPALFPAFGLRPAL
jgi:hypothetical protein